jgi:hypothetical protein
MSRLIMIVTPSYFERHESKTPNKNSAQKATIISRKEVEARKYGEKSGIKLTPNEKWSRLDDRDVRKRCKTTEEDIS